MPKSKIDKRNIKVSGIKTAITLYLTILKPSLLVLILKPSNSCVSAQVGSSNCRVRYLWGRIRYFNQSEAIKQCCLDSDWLKFEDLPRNYRTLLVTVKFENIDQLSIWTNLSWNWPSGWMIWLKSRNSKYKLPDVHALLPRLTVCMAEISQNTSTFCSLL